MPLSPPSTLSRPESLNVDYSVTYLQHSRSLTSESDGIDADQRAWKDDLDSYLASVEGLMEWNSFNLDFIYKPTVQETY
jgi:hypothetical protein